MTAFRMIMGVSFALVGIAAGCGALILIVESIDPPSRQMLKPAALFGIVSAVLNWIAILLWGLS